MYCFTGLADEIKPLFKVAWNDNSDPDKGFKYRTCIWHQSTLSRCQVQWKPNW